MALNYYLIEEDRDFDGKLFLGKISLNIQERRAMVTGERRLIPSNSIEIPLKYPPKERASDYLSLKFPFVSEKLKDIITQVVTAKVQFRLALLRYDNQTLSYFYLLPPQYDCIDHKHSKCERDERMPGGLRITDGFYIRRDRLEKLDLFRVDGLSNRKLVISERLKECFEAEKAYGLIYTKTEKYRD